MDPAGPSVVHLLHNPTARAADVRLDQVEAALAGRGVEVIRIEASSRDATELAAVGAVADGAERLVVLGGDGMVHLAVQAVAEQPTVLGVLPFGTGNDFARSVGLPDELDAAVEAALGPPVPLDLLRIGGRWCASVATLGFSVIVNSRANTMKWPRGASRYTWATLLELRSLKPLEIELLLDDTSHRMRATLVTAANTTDFGGGMRVSPDADPTDGMLDVTVVGDIGRLQLLRWFRRVFDGTHLDHPAVSTMRGRRLEITRPATPIWADGEPVSTTPEVIEVVPGALMLAGLGPRPGG